MSARLVWYFAYGSNLAPERFAARVGAWRARLPAMLPGWALRFSAEVISEGGAGAVIVPEPGAATFGAVYRISLAQLHALDREEFAPSRDPAARGVRRRVRVQTDAGPHDAETYTIPSPGTPGRPSERYLGFILRGLEAAGHPAAVLEEVRDSAGARP